MTFPNHLTMFGAAVVEAVRWWLAFDGPRSKMVSRNANKLTRDDVRAIALTYNFARNLPSYDSGVDVVCEHVNIFSGRGFRSFSERASELAVSIQSIQEQLASPERKKNFRIVSGMTKLTWFVAPDNWTPFDRLAAKAVRARSADTLDRMVEFYRKLDESGFAESSEIITNCGQGTPFQGMSGERILDKYLMGYGEPEWTASMLQENSAFEESLPPTWRSDLIAFKDSVLQSSATKFDCKAFQ